MKLNSHDKQRLLSYYPELEDYFQKQEMEKNMAQMKDKLSSPYDLLMQTILSMIAAKLEHIKGDKGDKGDDGYSPVKGKDYFTEEEITSLIGHIKLLATPKKGVDYNDGDNYILTEKDKKDIARKIDVPVLEKVIEKTEVIKESLPKSIDVSIVKGAVSKKELEIEKKTILDGMAKVDGRIKLIDQRYHGAGLSKVSHDSTLTGSGTPSDPLGVASVSGYQAPISGTIDGSNKTFVWTTAPKAITVDQGRNMQKVNSAPDSTVNWTGTTTTVLTVAPTFDIFSTA